MPIIAAFSVGATSAQVQAWFLVAIASSLLHSTGAQQEMLFVVDRWNHRIMSWEVGGNAGKAVAGSASGGVYGQSLKLLSNPGGVDIANNGETIFVSDTDNHRIVRWREGDTEGEVVAGGNGKGSKPNQLNFPYGIVAGLGGASIFVVDSENARVVVWFVGGKEASVIVAGGNGKGAKENQLDNPRGVAVGGTSVFVADSANHRVMLWKSDAYQGLIVAGGKGQGTGLHQLDSPQDVEVIMDGLEYKAVFVADSGNNRVVKWVPGDTKGVVVAGGNGKGAQNDQLSYPSGVAVANGGDTLYVSDRINNRVMKWENGATAGTVVAGGNGVGRSPRQLTMPYDIATWKGTTTSTTTRTETTATTVTVTSTTSTTSTFTTTSSTTSQTGTSLRPTVTTITTTTSSTTLNAGDFFAQGDFVRGTTGKYDGKYGVVTMVGASNIKMRQCETGEVTVPAVPFTRFQLVDTAVPIFKEGDYVRPSVDGTVEDEDPNGEGTDYNSFEFIVMGTSNDGRTGNVGYDLESIEINDKGEKTELRDIPGQCIETFTTTTTTTTTTTDAANALYVGTFVKVIENTHTDKFGVIISISARSGRRASIATCSGITVGDDQIPFKSLEKIDVALDDTLVDGNHVQFKYGDYANQVGTIKRLESTGYGRKAQVLRTGGESITVPTRCLSATMSSTTGTTSPSTTQTSITTPVTTKTTATTSVSTIATPTATTTSTTPPITTETTTTNTKTTPTSTATTTSGAATTTTTTTVVTFNFPGVSLNELNETDIATLKADLLKKMNNATGNGVNISSIFISLVDNDSSSGTSSGAADSNAGTANTNANNSSSDDVAAFVLLEPGPASNSAAAVALAFDKVDQQIEAGAFKVTVNGRDVTITQPSTRTYFVAVVVGPDNQLRLVQGNPTAADPCNSIACSILCEGECGWSRAAGQCKLGYTTTARMMQDELGNCTGVIGTSSVPPKPTAATIAGSVAGSIGVVALLVAAALICRAKAKSNEGGSFDFEQHLTVLHEEQKAIRAEVEGLNVVHGLQEAAGAGGAEGRPPPLPPLPPPRINAINREDLLVIDVLGSGNFGEVLKCTLNGTVVAVKVVKINAKKVASLSAPEIQAKLHKENISLGNEATIMMSLGTHPHVVQLIGVVRNKGPLMVVLQAEGGGDLKKVLGERETGRRQNGAAVNFAEKHRWVHEIASGMVHIAGKHIVHRDIAARNIMVSLSGTCKIADFGLARVMKKKKARHSSDEDEIYESYYRATNSYFPIRWTAPEGLRHSRFSTSSDVWSFAIVIVEIWRNGGKPYPDHNNRAVRYGLEMDQTFMHPNVGCPDELYGLMTDCWKQDPDARPTFAHILTRLEQTDGKLKRSSVQHFDQADSNDDDGYEKPISTVERRVGMPSTTAITSTAGAVVMSPVFEFAERDADALLETTLL